MTEVLEKLTALTAPKSADRSGRPDLGLSHVRQRSQSGLVPSPARHTMDNWDPLFLDCLAENFTVTVFDYSGLGYSTGTRATPRLIWRETSTIWSMRSGLGKVDHRRLVAGRVCGSGVCGYLSGESQPCAGDRDDAAGIDGQAIGTAVFRNRDQNVLHSGRRIYPVLRTSIRQKPCAWRCIARPDCRPARCERFSHSCRNDDRRDVGIERSDHAISRSGWRIFGLLPDDRHPRSGAMRRSRSRLSRRELVCTQ